jgi:hypothetical protein
MTLNKDADMRWNLDNIRFLYPPDDFLGTFTNPMMQARHEAAQKKKIADIMEKLLATDDPFQAMIALNSRSHLHFLLNNIELFKKSGVFEKTVLLLYYRKNTPFVGTDDLPTWIKLFKLCDRQLLYGLGTPITAKEMTVYRGSVTGISQGLSWTTSPEKVAWFLDRWKDTELGGGTVFSLQVNRQDILVHIVDKEKQEVILDPDFLEDAQPVEVNSIPTPP